MLSRIAESLYWIGRYVERAEDTARILDVQYHLLLEDPWANEEATCRALLDVMGLGGQVEEPDAESVTHLPTNLLGLAAMLAGVAATLVWPIDVEVAVDGGRAQRLAHVVAVAGGDAVQHLLAFHLAVAPAEQVRGHLGHEDLVGGQVPFPDAAAGGLDGGAEALLGVRTGDLDPGDPAHLQKQQGAEGEDRADA